LSQQLADAITGVELEMLAAPLDSLRFMGFISATWHRFSGGALDPQRAPEWLRSDGRSHCGDGTCSTASGSTPALGTAASTS
jgi:hypothetical protein